MDNRSDKRNDQSQRVSHHPHYHHDHHVISTTVNENSSIHSFQVAPAELEAILISSSNISDVAVTSIYNAATATELPRAYIVPANSQLRSLCTTSNHTKEDVQRFAELGQHVKEFVEKRTVHYKWYVVIP